MSMDAATTMAIAAASVLANSTTANEQHPNVCHQQEPSDSASLTSLVALIIDAVIARFGIFGVVYLFAIFYITLVCLIQIVDMYQFIWDFYWMQLQLHRQQQQQHDHGPLNKPAPRLSKAQIQQCLSTCTYAESSCCGGNNNSNTELSSSSSSSSQHEPCCPICLSDFQPADIVTRLDRTQCPECCGHFFHGTCLSQWLDVSPSCPHCRYELFPQVQPQSLRQQQTEIYYENPLSERATSISARMELASLQLEHTILTAMAQFGQWTT